MYTWNHVGGKDTWILETCQPTSLSETLSAKPTNEKPGENKVGLDP